MGAVERCDFPASDRPDPDDGSAPFLSRRTVYLATSCPYDNQIRPIFGLSEAICINPPTASAGLTATCCGQPSRLRNMERAVEIGLSCGRASTGHS